MKTNLGTPARRSAGIMSSPSKAAGTRHSAGRSSPLASDSPSRHRQIGAAPQRRVGLSRPPLVQQQPRPVKKRNFDLEVSEDDHSEQEDDNVSESDAPPEEDEVPEEDELLEVNGDDSPPIPADESLDIPRSDEEDPAPQVKRKPGRPRRTEVTARAKQAPNDPPKKRGRPRKNATTADQGRPAKRAKKEDVRHSTPDAVEPEAATPTRRSDKAAISTPEQKGIRPPTKAGAKSQSKAHAAAGASDSTKPRARGLRILRSETPAADYGATVMRSGRTSVKPLAYWRNERAVYDTGRVYGKDRELGGIKEVIRTEEISPEPRRRPRKRGGRKRRAPEAIEEDEDIQEWEEEPGYLEARVPKWDPLTNNVSEDVEEEIGKQCLPFPALPTN
jgi:centromere protein C